MERENENNAVENEEFDPFGDDFFADTEDEENTADADDNAGKDAADTANDATDDAGADDTADGGDDGGENDGNDGDNAGEGDDGKTKKESENTGNDNPENKTDGFFAKANADMAEIEKLFPGLSVKNLLDLKDPKRFGELRDMGLSVKEAFLATNGAMLEERAAAAGEKKAAGKAHLQSVAKKAGVSAASQVSRQEIENLRDYYSDDELSDSELESLILKVK